MKGVKEIGFIEYRRGNNIFNITNLQVNKEDCSKGNGSILLNYFEKQIKKENDINEIKVCCTDKSKKFYKKNGYISDKLYDNGIDIHFHYHKILKDDRLEP
jgi:N-acetylglutamate synthase-like GNAT family acetyltransferase|tara:strand:+ start:247 stop:549 length:303 start_codon:yes stop_codon:yes gene_type:complete